MRHFSCCNCRAHYDRSVRVSDFCSAKCSEEFDEHIRLDCAIYELSQIAGEKVEDFIKKGEFYTNSDGRKFICKMNKNARFWEYITTDRSTHYFEHYGETVTIDGKSGSINDHIESKRLTRHPLKTLVLEASNGHTSE